MRCPNCGSHYLEELDVTSYYLDEYEIYCYQFSCEDCGHTFYMEDPE